MHLMDDNALFDVKYLAYHVNMDVDSCGLSMIMMSMISKTIGTDMDLVKKKKRG